MNLRMPSELSGVPFPSTLLTGVVPKTHPIKFRPEALLEELGAVINSNENPGDEVATALAVFGKRARSGWCCQHLPPH
jgi:hypothetical protein